MPMKTFAVLLGFYMSSIAHAKPDYPLPTGTFIQNYLVAKWDDAKWQSEFAYLKRAGMHQIVFAPTLDGKSHETEYPSAIAGTTAPRGDLVDRLLRNAKKAGFTVFLGLNVHDDWWQAVAQDRKWLLGQMEIGNQVADELYHRYRAKYPKTFVGWYWVWEADNYRFIDPKHRELLAAALETNVKHLKQLDPKMPVMLCPFMNWTLGKPQQFADTWTYVFQNTSLGKGDIFAPQDCVGAGGLKMDNFLEWMKAMADATKVKPGLRFWTDAETFDQRDWSPAPLKRFVSQLRQVQPIVEQSITFAYSHYYSPNNVNPAYQKAFEQYVRTGLLDSTIPPAPSGLKLVSKEGKVVLEWLSGKSRNGDLGYEILRNGKTLGKVQVPKNVRHQAEVVSYTDSKPEEGATYTVRAFDVIGNESAQVAFP